MSKETTAGIVCACGNTIVFQEQHWDHCPEKDRWNVKPKVREDKKSGRQKSRRV